MNTKRCFFAFIAAFLFIFGFEFLFHGMFMKSAYMETATLWRPEAEFHSHFPLLLLGQAVIAFFFVAIYCRGFSGSGVAGGVRLGILLALIFAGGELIQFAVQPLTTKILISWIIGGLIEFAIVGAIVGAIYKPSTTSTMLS
ncbi:MAG: hypothetical protein M3R29_04565 [Verrucomicrobiota bacterium]|nr:hypothetical protein [Verrucomicrobiota bacterium]